MRDRARRRELTTEYRQNPPQAGVYRFVNRLTGKVLLGSAVNLASVQSKVDFARATKSTGGLDHRLEKEIREHGIDVFTLEILDTLEITPEMSQAEVRAELATLEALWRERQDPALLY